MRSTAFRYLAYSKKSRLLTCRFKQLVMSGIIVDDEALIHLTHCLIHANIRKSNRTEHLVRETARKMQVTGDMGLHCALLLASKFLHRAEILLLLLKNRDRIAGDFWLARQAAGLLPRFLGFGHHHDIFQRFVRGLGNDEAERVILYLLELAQCTHLSSTVEKYLLSPNESFPQKIYFPKVIHLLAISKNPHLTHFMGRLHVHHPALANDPYFRSMGFDPPTFPSPSTPSAGSRPSGPPSPASRRRRRPPAGRAAPAGR